MKWLLWLLAIIWLPCSFLLGDFYADKLKFRINDFSAVPGIGTVQRDQDGVFYHVNAQNEARPIFSIGSDGSLSVTAPIYAGECLDCNLVSGAQLSQTNDFCAVGYRTELPKVSWEAPCETWATLGNGTRTMTGVFFFAPIIIFFLTRMVLRSFVQRRKQLKNAKELGQ